MALSDQPVACPWCGRVNEIHVGETSSKLPKDGDFAICWGCKRFAVFSIGPFGLTQRLPTEEELDEIAGDPRAQSALANMIGSKNPIQAVAQWRRELNGQE